MTCTKIVECAWKYACFLRLSCVEAEYSKMTNSRLTLMVGMQLVNSNACMNALQTRNAEGTLQPNE